MYCRAFILAALLAAAPALAQEPAVRLRIVDTGGVPIPFAVVSMGNARALIADDSGRLVLPVHGTVQGSWTTTSINASGTSTPPPGPKLDIDELVDGRSVMAIEVYPSGANAPAELIPFGGRASCGIVAIWTGGRH